MSDQAVEKPTKFLIFAVLMLSLVNMQDGFDILAISYAAHSISEEWKMSRSELGIVFSAGLLGMMLGAMFLASLADHYGRKKITIFGLFLSGCGMIMAMLSPTLTWLIAARVLTGLGVGAILASLNTLVSEYSGKSYRVAAICFFQLGFSMGAFIAGFLTAWLLGMGSWRYVFAFGAFTSFAFIPIIMVLPESTAFLAKQGKGGALEKINHIRKKFGREPLNELPAVSEARRSSIVGSVKALGSRPYIYRTALIWVAFFLLLTVLYFLLSWTPKMIVDLGFTEADGNRGGKLINLCGMFGIMFIAVLGSRIKPSFITSIYLVCLAILLLGFGRFASSLSSILLAVGLIGIFVHGSMIGLYSTVPSLYPTHLRATGTGWAIGISRFGAVLGPAIAGFLFDGGWEPQTIFKMFAIPSFLAALAAFFIWRLQKRPDFLLSE